MFELELLVISRVLGERGGRKADNHSRAEQSDHSSTTLSLEYKYINTNSINKNENTNKNAITRQRITPTSAQNTHFTSLGLDQILKLGKVNM